MACLTIRNLEDTTKARLRIRAARHGRSMEDEVRTILRAALGNEDATGQNLAQRIRARFASLGDIELPQSEREDIRKPPSLID